MADQALVDRAMRAQLQRFRQALARGMPRLGWKIGINDPKMLARLGVDAPVVGWLAGDRAVETDQAYTLVAGTRVSLEAEVAIRLGGGGAIDALAPAFELVNYNLPGSAFEGIVEHDIFHDAVAFGRRSLPIALEAGDWPIVTRNGKEAARRDPELLMLEPADAIKHVAATLSRYGECLETGDWVILGSLIKPIPLRPGDRIEADFGPLGALALSIG
jgi:2-oxo-hept-3-ene-1,7-dioate hydratase